MRPLGAETIAQPGLGRGPGRSRAWALAAALGAALTLGGCGSISDFVAARGSELPGVGLPEGAPARPATRAEYPAVHDMPPKRDAPLLDRKEQREVEDDLMDARARNQRAGGQPVTPPVQSAPEQPPAQPAARQPSSRRSIF